MLSILGPLDGPACAPLRFVLTGAADLDAVSSVRGFPAGFGVRTPSLMRRGIGGSPAAGRGLVHQAADATFSRMIFG